MAHTLAYLCGSKSWGGLEMNQLRNALWMKERGHEVIFFCRKDTPLATEVEKAGLSAVYLSPYRKYYDFKAGKMLCNKLREKAITHLIIRSTYDMSIAAYCKSKLGDKIHLSYFMEMQLGVKKTNLLHTLRFRKIDLWSCPLPFLAKQVETMTRFPKERIRIIPSGIDLNALSISDSQAEAREKLELPANMFLFGLIGRFDPQKGQLLLLEAAMKAQNTDFGIVFLGEPTKNEGAAYYRELQGFITQNQLEKRVFIRGFRKDIATFYRAIDWFVMASKAETFGMVTIEAMACGTPTLGSNAGGTPEILEHGKLGALFQTLDAADLAVKLDEIVSGKQAVSPGLLLEKARQYDHRLVCELVGKNLGLTTL
ncbi:MAG: hypothetical protein K0R65_1612 [Crocinitomicaceae bacterium]|jgi:glycosyltransferase involved in cell wall biosynthesis|nr:hypothetical protein [Crocinitomicaceae bacterium]